jgi:hypothetical protein
MYILFGCITAAIAGISWPMYSIIFSEMVNLFYETASQIRAQSYLWSIAFASVGIAMMIVSIGKFDR